MSEPRPLKVFLCHASADKPAVRKLHRYLKQRGVQPWLDELDLLPGQDWQAEIPKAIFSADVILVCLSKNSINKEGYVQKEITYALDKAMEKPEGTIFIIPAKLEECDVPQRLSRYHWVDLSRADGHRRLMLSLNLRAASLPDVKQAKVTDESSPRLPNLESFRVEKEKTINDVSPKWEETVSKPIKPIANLSRKFNFRKTGITIIALLSLSLGIWGIGYFIKQSINSTQPPSSTLTDDAMKTLEQFATGTARAKTLTASAPTSTSTPTLTPTPKPPTPIPTLGIGSTKISEKDGINLVYVSEGEFLMGGNVSRFDQAKPEHTVYVDAFWIDKTEVTNAMFTQFVNRTGYVSELEEQGITWLYNGSWYDRDGAGWRNPFGSGTSLSGREDFPVIQVTWNDAVAYCQWAGRRLPTEAEWEKAARGSNGYLYPWGNNVPSSNLANYGNQIGDIVRVGNYPGNVSPYGALDMGGNVYEWVADYFSLSYYAGSPPSNQPGPSSGKYKVMRGGSWQLDAEALLTYNREIMLPNIGNSNVGFRCAQSEP